MNGKQLKNSILQWAIQGKLVPQDPNDEPASVLLEKIRQEKERLIKEKKIKRDKNASIIYRGEDNSYYEKLLATGEVKCIDEEIPFEIPQGWEWCRVSSLFQINPKVVAEDNTSAAFIPMEAISAGYGSEFRYYEKKWGEIKSGYTAFADNDIAFAKITPCFQNRKSAIFEGLPNGIGAGTTELKILRTYGETINRWFVLYFLESPYFIDEATFKGTANQQRIIVGYLENKLFPLPPLAEQERIVGKIGLVMPIIDKYSKSQEILDKMNVELNECLKKSVLQEAIQGKLVPQIAEEGTAQELLEQIRVEKQKLVKEGKLKKSALNNSAIFRGDDNKYWEKSTECMESIDDNIPFEIPSTWCWVRHNQLFEISGGSQPPKSQFVDNPKSGYIRLYQIRDYGSNPMPVYIPKEKANKITKEGDIILARYGGSLGKVFWAKDGAYNVAMAKVIPLFESEFVNKQYLFLFYQSSIYQYLVKDHSRSAQAGFNKDDLTDLFFPLPPLEEQSRIVEKYKSVTSIMSK